MGTDERLKRLIAGKPEKPKKPRAKKPKKDAEPEIDLLRLDEMSETELVEVAKLVGCSTASRQLPRDHLIALILGEEGDPEDPLRRTREVIYAYVQANTRIMRSMLTCDLHCPTCPHHQVVECYADNQDLVE